MITVAICEQFGWDYHTFDAQPAWFIDLIREKMRLDAIKAEQQKRKK